MILLGGKITVHAGDCLDVIRTLADNSVDSCVTDPPYNLGFMGRAWDRGSVAFTAELWREVLRVLKPGAHLVAFSGTRTYHRMACAIEDAGFEIRDQIQWVYGSGFPKSHDVSKGIDKAAGAEREVVGVTVHPDGRPRSIVERDTGIHDGGHTRNGVGIAVTAPSTPEAIRWSGWGTALKPAVEPICLARKPLEGTVAANVLKHGTGAINVGACRVPTSADDAAAMDRCNTPGSGRHLLVKKTNVFGQYEGGAGNLDTTKGRWPANLIHDGSDEVLAAFPETKSAGHYRDPDGDCEPRDGSNTNVFVSRDAYNEGARRRTAAYSGDSGSAARFFYSAKADADDRLGSRHPTVKPLDLMQYLVRLVTPLGGVVLDPFAGTGTTGEAAFREAARAILIEREPEYLRDIERRCSLILAGPVSRSHATIKAKGKAEDAGPLFEVRP